MADLDPEDAKLLTLARSARARCEAPEGAAVRDDTGRTYAAASVDLPGLRLSALQAAVAAAVSSGARRFEALLLVADRDELTAAESELVRAVGQPPVHQRRGDGSPLTG